MTLTRDHVVWAYRLLLDREPENDYVAFEPFEANADCLAQAIRENRFEDRLTVERGALGAASVEGAEPMALIGARRLLKKDHRYHGLAPGASLGGEVTTALQGEVASVAFLPH